MVREAAPSVYLNDKSRVWKKAMGDEREVSKQGVNTIVAGLVRECDLCSMKRN